MQQFNRNAIKLIAFGAISWAGVTDASAQQEGDGNLVLDEIIVTAQKRTESLQDVPISISVFSGEEIEENRIESLQDFLELTPNVSFNNQGTSTDFELGIRGVSNLGGASNVFGVYVDEFNVAPGSANTTFDQRLVDIERLEVLRGPQGTFFGRNVSGGAISITTRKPQPEFEALALAEIATYDNYLIRGSLNVPLVGDRLLARVTGFAEDFGGYLKNDGPSDATNDREESGGRIALRWLPTDRLIADLGISYYTLDQGFPNFVPSGTLDDVLASLGLQPFPVEAGFYPENTEHIETDEGRRIKADTLIATARLEYSADAYTVTSVTGIIDSDTTQNGESDYTAFSMYSDYGFNDLRSWSTELRVQSALSGDWQWMLGGIYAHDEIEEFLNRTFLRDWFSVLLGLPPDFPVPPQVSVINDLSTSDITSYGVFGELSWSGLNEDRLRLSLSARWQRDEIEQSFFSPRQAALPPFGTSVDDFAGSASFSNLMPRFAATYEFSRDLTGYAVVSKGVKPGGYNLGSEEVPGSPLRFDEEVLWNYEVGLKGNLLNDRVRYSFAAFHMDWEDIQVGQFFFDPVTFSGVDLTINGTSAVSDGMELEFTALPTERIRLSAAIGYNDATFDDFENAIVGANGETADVSGNLLPMSTKWTGNAAAEYRHPLAGDDEAFIRLQYIYRGDTYDDIDNRDVEGDLIPSYDLLNLRLGYEGDRYTFIAFVDNVTDEEHVTGWLADSSLSGVLAVVNPRIWGLRAIARFE